MSLLRDLEIRIVGDSELFISHHCNQDLITALCQAALCQLRKPTTFIFALPSSESMRGKFCQLDQQDRQLVTLWATKLLGNNLKTIA